MSVPPFPESLLEIPGFTPIDDEHGIFLVDPPVAPTPGDTDPTFGHWCPRPGYHVETDEPLFPRYVMAGTGLHTVHSRDPWHLEASLLCEDCGCHGWIREGRWVSA